MQERSQWRPGGSVVGGLPARAGITGLCNQAGQGVDVAPFDVGFQCVQGLLEMLGLLQQLVFVGGKNVAPHFGIAGGNVGGETLDTALLHLRMDARVVLCGAIAGFLLSARDAGFAVPDAMLQKSLERLNEEIKRRTRVVRIFPNTESCLRLIRALCVETHETWLEDNRYLNMALLAEQKKELLRLAA